jgi:hypothetical protein
MRKKWNAPLEGWILLAAILAGGCGSGKPQTVVDTEESLAKQVVSSVSEHKLDAEKFGALFVEGTAPDDATRKRFEPYMCYAVSTDVSGNSATADVQFEVLATGELLGPFQWTLEKVGEQWKVKSIALP